jgi:hypothetical protein
MLRVVSSFGNGHYYFHYFGIAVEYFVVSGDMQMSSAFDSKDSADDVKQTQHTVNSTYPCSGNREACSSRSCELRPPANLNRDDYALPELDKLQYLISLVVAGASDLETRMKQASLPTGY